MRLLSASEDDDELEELELDLLLLSIVRRYGYDYRHYARAPLRRRVWNAVQAEGLETIAELRDRVLRDPHCCQRLVTALSVTVSTLFRDPLFFRALRTEVVPWLRTYPFVRVWVAGCAAGEEVYSLAILLQEEGLEGRARIYGTDISEDALARATRGVFSQSRLSEYSENYLQAGGRHDLSQYCRVEGDEMVMNASLRGAVVFAHHNLASDASFNEFHLILCRNVMIYFGEALRQRVHDLLHTSLCTFGVLGVGMRETVRLARVEPCYETLDGQLRLFRKVR